eukprot:166975_1
MGTKCNAPATEHLTDVDVEQTNQYNAKNTETLNNFKIRECNGSVSGCEYLKDLLIVMNEYMKNLPLEKIDTDDVINIHIHLINEHDDNGDFEFIHDKMNAENCNLFHCDIFMRNHRNQNKTILPDLFHSNDVEMIAHQQILDKIHSHYVHAFDIGHRLRITEKIHEKNITSAIKLLQNKHRKYREIHQNLGRLKKSKFVTMTENKNNDDQKQNNNRNVNKYDFGIQFCYDGYFQSVHSKYNSFKEELTCNHLMSINMYQFQSELKKAEKYFNSYYCQQQLIKKNPYKIGSVPMLKALSVTAAHILSVLIYCNYDCLQYEYAKTYRPNHPSESKQSICKRHGEFYFLGKFLTQAVHRIGVCGLLSKRPTNSFYHGITEKLLFSIITQSNSRILSPLSTSSSMEVAINFAGTQGLLVEFAESYGFYNNCFSASWCSDFPNEKEHIFIKNS